MKPKLYFTSDWHIGHFNCLALDGRPFKDLDHMNEMLIKNFNFLVPHHGITYFLGDMGFSKSGLLKKVITRLNGKKILIPGNHDDKGMYAYYDAGFDFVTDKAQIVIGKSIITMSHCPLKGIYREDTTGMANALPGENWHRETKHSNRYAMDDFGQFHLHGHIHSPNGGRSKRILDRQMDVGVVCNGYKPVSISTVESFVAKYNNNNGGR